MQSFGTHLAPGNLTSTCLQNALNTSQANLAGVSTSSVWQLYNISNEQCAVGYAGMLMQLCPLDSRTRS